MDFGLTQEQDDLKALAKKMFDELSPAERLPDFDTGQDWFDEKLWQELAKAQLLGIALPEDVGGVGMGLVELALLLEQAGAACCPVPLLATLVMGAAPVNEFGTEAQRKALLPEVIAGKLVLTAALADEGSREPSEPTTRATADGGDWRLTGTKLFVPAARLAGRVLVPARTSDADVGVFLVDPRADGVTLVPTTTTTGEYQYRIDFDSALVTDADVLGDPTGGRAIVEWIVERTLAGLCATELGVAERALRMTATYASERKQFDKPIATFQAVAQRAGDAYIDIEAIRLSTLQAVWRLATGRPAARELAIAKFWASEGGHRACYAAQHLHGGIGVDTDYPLHHYYLLSRQIELTLGSGQAQLARIGRMLADDEWASLS